MTILTRHDVLTKPRGRAVRSQPVPSRDETRRGNGSVLSTVSIRENTNSSASAQADSVCLEQRLAAFPTRVGRLSFHG
jgi:hypothetical protein